MGMVERSRGHHAGLRVIAGRSVNGNGTATTSSGSQVTPGVLVLGRGPLAHRCGKALQVIVPAAPDLPHDQVVALDLEGDHVSLEQTGPFSDARGNGRLAARRDPRYFHARTYHILFTVIEFIGNHETRGGDAPPVGRPRVEVVPVQRFLQELWGDAVVR